MRRSGWVAAGLAAVTILAAGCGGGAPLRTVAGSTKTAGGPASHSGQPSLLDYSKCMRSHGVHDFPDPGNNGQSLTLNGTKGSDLDPNSPIFKSASEACKALAPQPGAAPANPAIKAGALKYSACMRSHGFPKFPDPGADGGIQVQGGPDLDPQSAQFKAADKICQHFMAQPPGGAPGQGGPQFGVNNGVGQ